MEQGVEQRIEQSVEHLVVKMNRVTNESRGRPEMFQEVEQVKQCWAKVWRNVVE